MKMISMGFVIIRGECDAKYIASGGSGIAQEFPFFPRSIPILENFNQCPVLQLKCGNVPSIGKGMFGPLAGTVSALTTAGIGAVMVDFGEGLIEMFAG